MGNYKQAPKPAKKTKTPELAAVPSPPISKQVIKELHKLNSGFNDAFEAYQTVEKKLENYFYSQKGWTGFILGWKSVGDKKAFISSLPPGITAKKDFSETDLKEISKLLNTALKLLTIMTELAIKSNALIEKIDKNDITEAKAKGDYINLHVNVFYVQEIADQYEQGVTAAEEEYKFITKPSGPTISAQKGKVIPIEKAPLIELPPTMEDVFTYGPGHPIYYDPVTGAYGSKEVIDFAKDVKAGKVDLNSGFEEAMILIPIIGPGICIVNDVQKIKYGTPEEKKEGKIMLGVDVAFMGVDVHWIVHLGVRSATQMVARDAITKMAKEKAAGAIITNTEKKVFVQAAYDLSEKEMKELLKIAQRKGGWNIVTKELLEISNASKKGTLSKQVMKDYISSEGGAGKKVKGFFKSIYHDFAGVTEQGFAKHSKEFLAREMLHGTNFKYMNYGAMLDELTTPQKKAALAAIFNTNMTFSHGAQKELYTLVKKKGWTPLLVEIEKQVKELGGMKAVKAFRAGTLDSKMLLEATNNAMRNLLPKYSLAYAISPFKEWIKLGAFLGATGVAFHYARVMGSYVMAKGENMIKKELKEIKKMQESAEAAEALPELTEEQKELQTYAADVTFEGVFGAYVESALGE